MGVGATIIIEGAVNAQFFDAFVEHFLVPTLLKGDLVLPYNVKFHYSERAIDLIEKAGADVLQIPHIRRTSTRLKNVYQRSMLTCVQQRLKPNENFRTLSQRTLRELQLTISADGSQIAATFSHSSDNRCSSSFRPIVYRCNAPKAADGRNDEQGLLIPLQ
jgi:hypothetical protein